MNDGGVMFIFQVVQRPNLLLYSNTQPLKLRFRQKANLANALWWRRKYKDDSLLIGACESVVDNQFPKRTMAAQERKERRTMAVVAAERTKLYGAEASKAIDKGEKRTFFIGIGIGGLLGPVFANFVAPGDPGIAAIGNVFGAAGAVSAVIGIYLWVRYHKLINSVGQKLESILHVQKLADGLKPA